MSNRNDSQHSNDPSAVGVSRRALLQGAVAGGAALAVSGFPAILGAQDKAGDKPLVVGTGAHTYEWVDNWAKLPEGKRFGNTHAVVETADGRIFVHSASPTGDATCVFDPDGKFIKSWGERFAPNAHGMDYRKEGGEEFLYLAPTGMHKVYKVTLDGEIAMEIDYPKEAKNAKGEPIYADAEVEKKDKDGNVSKSVKKGSDAYVPTFIALPPGSEDFYVADGYGASYVHRYNAKAEYVSTFGGKGSGEGQLNCPHGIWWDDRDPANPLVLVADRSNVRLQWFTPDGKFVRMVKDELRHPCHFDIRGKDVLIPDLHGRVTIFDKDDKLICHLGDNADPAKFRGKNNTPAGETRPGTFYTPHGAMWDAKGNAFVVEWLPYGRVTKLKKVDA